VKGWKTLAVNVGLASGVAGLTYLAGVDWTQYVSPNVALIGAAAVNVLLRVITTSPIFKPAA
jgi:hypothetical protein